MWARALFRSKVMKDRAKTSALGGVGRISVHTLFRCYAATLFHMMMSSMYSMTTKT